VSVWQSRVMRKLRPGVATTLGHVDEYRRAWETETERALAAGATGPLWVVLGDSTAQGIGASSWDRGYVGLLRAQLEARDSRSWRVVNLSRTGARLSDVLAEQIPALARLGRKLDLVTCACGANDLVRPWMRHLPDVLRTLAARLPSGAVIATLPQGLGRRRAQLANAVIRSEAPGAGLLVADVWAGSGPPWQGKFAADDFHPNDTGYRSWCDAFAAALGLPAL